MLNDIPKRKIPTHVAETVYFVAEVCKGLLITQQVMQLNCTQEKFRSLHILRKNCKADFDGIIQSAFNRV